MILIENIKKACSAEKRRLKYYQSRFESGQINKEDFDLKKVEISTRLSYLIPLQNAVIHQQELTQYMNALISKINIGSSADALIKAVNAGFDKEGLVNYEVDNISANYDIQYGFDNLKATLKDLKYKDLMRKIVK